MSFRGFWALCGRTVVIVASGCGKGGNLVLVFHFSMAAKPGGGNVGISRFLRDSQGTVGRAGKLLLLFRAFHGPVISTTFSPGSDARSAEETAYFKWYRRSLDAHRQPYLGGRSGDSLLHRRSICILAAVIFRAHSVSLICRAV
jgi:hypothetical protein